MENLVIKLSSVVVPLIEGKTMAECRRVNREAKEKCVWIEFFDDSVRVTGHYTRKMKVPAKALKDGQALISWMEQRIDKAWS